MKKTLVFVLLASLFALGSAQAKIVGDFNSDGEITVSDVVMYLMYLSGRADIPELGSENYTGPDYSWAVTMPKSISPTTDLIYQISTYVPGERYAIQVSLPTSYSSTTYTYPVIYVLDSDKSFGMVHDIVNWLNWSGDLHAEIIIVGITYGVSETHWWESRTRDYSPVKDNGTYLPALNYAGHAENFKSFLKEELFPLIDSTYRTNSDRTIVGLSLGALFAHWILFTEPEFFSKYIISGSPILWGDSYIVSVEEEYFKNHTSLQATVFSTVGSDDDNSLLVKPANDFAAVIEGRNYSGLAFTHVVLEGATHITAWPTCLVQGIPWVYSH